MRWPDALPQSVEMKQSLLYDQISCRLRVDGLPDLSAGHAAHSIGIVTGWSLQWVGRPELEGRREHLLALMQVVLPYARHLISGVAKRFGEPDQPVEIGPNIESGHRVLLRSSEPDTPPLEVHLDDAELADLVRVLDQLRLDPRLQLVMPVPDPEPLRARELLEKIPLQRRLAVPLGGLAALSLAAAAVVLLPPPPAPSPASRQPETSQPRRSGLQTAEPRARPVGEPTPRPDSK